MAKLAARGIAGAAACVLYAVQPDLGYVSALLIGFLLGVVAVVAAFVVAASGFAWLAALVLDGAR